MSVGTLGTLDCLNRRRDVVGSIAVGYRDDLQAAVELLPADDPRRWHLEALLSSIGQVVEAEAAFRAECQAVAS